MLPGTRRVLTVRTMPLHTYPDPVLKRVAAPFPVADLHHHEEGPRWQGVFAQAAKDLAYQGGYAVAGPQLGSSLRWFVVDAHRDLGTHRPAVFLNPEVIGESAETCIISEGCLSIPGFRAPVRRAQTVRGRWVDAEGVPREGTFDGLMARVFLHEHDHLNGTLFVDRLDFIQQGKAAKALNALRGRR